MFFGEHEHTLDEKGRITIPAAYRQALDKGLFITRGLDGCLFAYTLEDWQIMAEKLRNLPTTDLNARNFTRQMFSGSECKPDRQGRVLLPPSLRKHAGLNPGDEVVIIGVDARLEIWSRSRWDELTQKLETEGATYAAHLAGLGI